MHPIMFIIVLFPLPLGPIMATHSPLSTERLTSFKAFTVPPEYIFETSWEVCNRVGGIYTVLSTKAASMRREYGDKVIFFGPELWSARSCPFFKEEVSLLADWRKTAESEGLPIRIGRWTIPGEPIAVLVDFNGLYAQKNAIYGHLWQQFGVDSIQAYGDYDEASMFGYATGVAMESLYRFYHLENHPVVAHFNEWMTAFGLFYVKEHMPQVGTLFTTHATSIGRSIAGNDKPLYDCFCGYHGDQMARELNMVSKHSVEKQAALHADRIVDTTTDEERIGDIDELVGVPLDALLVLENALDLIRDREDFLDQIGRAHV